MQGNWGHLQNNIGWICLDYCKQFSEVNSGGYEVMTDTLNVRQAPSSNSKKLTQIHRGSRQGINYTAGNWGHLQNDIGWICLDYCKRI